MKKSWNAPEIEVLNAKQTEYWTTGKGNDGWYLTLGSGSGETTAFLNSQPGTGAEDVRTLGWLQKLLHH